MYPALTLAVAGVTVRAAGGDCDFHSSTQLSGACLLPLAQLGNSIVTLTAVTGWEAPLIGAMEIRFECNLSKRVGHGFLM